MSRAPQNFKHRVIFRTRGMPVRNMKERKGAIILVARYSNHNIEGSGTLSYLFINYILPKQNIIKGSRRNTSAG